MATAPDPRKIGRQKLAERDAPDLILSLKVDGKLGTYPVRFDEVSAAEIAGLRSAVGYGINQLQKYLAADPDIDVLAALVWLSRRQNGETSVTYDEVAEPITYGSIDPESLKIEQGSEPAGDEAEEFSPED